MRYKATILLLILCCSSCASHAQFRITDRVYAPIRKSDNWRRSYKIKYLAPSRGAASEKVLSRATMHMQSGNYREAAAILSSLSRNGSDADRIINNLGVAYEVLGERNKALASYAAACRLSPKNPYYRKNLNSL